jgi:hypothetical protein
MLFKILHNHRPNCSQPVKSGPPAVCQLVWTSDKINQSLTSSRLIRTGYILPTTVHVTNNIYKIKRTTLWTGLTGLGHLVQSSLMSLLSWLFDIHWHPSLICHLMVLQLGLSIFAYFVISLSYLFSKFCIFVFSFALFHYFLISNSDLHYDFHVFVFFFLSFFLYLSFQLNCQHSNLLIWTTFFHSPHTHNSHSSNITLHHHPMADIEISSLCFNLQSIIS